MSPKDRLRTAFQQMAPSWPCSIHKSSEASVDTRLIQPFPKKTLVNQNLDIETIRMMAELMILWIIRDNRQLWFKPKIWRISRVCRLVLNSYPDEFMGI